MTKDKFLKKVDDIISDCIRNDYSFGSYAYKVAEGIWPLLEAAEKELVEIRHGAAVANDTIKALRAKIAELGRQEPVMWVNSSNIDSSRINKERGGLGDQHTCSEKQTTYHNTPLYALPGAQGEEK